MAEQLSNEVNSLQINDSGGENTDTNGLDNVCNELGFQLDDLYKISLQFYKEKDGKGLHLTYKDKLKMVAYTKQASFGKYRVDVSPDVGFLDVVGNDRKQAWQSLGDMSPESAMQEFIDMLDRLCPLYTPHIQAKAAEREQQIQLQREESERKKQEVEDEERRLLEEEARRQLDLEKHRQHEQEKQIRAALNQQTEAQFRQYAEQQCPGNTQQHEELIVQLQEQHYQQYMQQVYQQQLLHQQQQYQQLQAMAAAEKAGQSPPPPTASPQAPPTSNSQAMPISTPGPINMQNGPVVPPTVTDTTNHNSGDESKDEEEDELPPIAAASLWTRKDVKEFKDSLKKDKDSVIKIGSGETVTVRVPTHEDGSCLFWEFASDYYDIGFGVYFEWTISPSNRVSVHISDSSDEEDVDEEGAGEAKPDDIEKGDKKDDRPPTDEIIPVYRRDCHEEVYCGSHAYPGRGVYLLKFDNSYSLWRSKTLYYRVYYSH